MSTPEETAQFIYSRDAFARLLGIELTEIREKYCRIRMPVKKEMINGLGSVHGGVTFSLADAALAFSSNNTGEASVALNCSINFIKAAYEGDILIAESVLISETRKTGIYDISVTSQHGDLVAGFRGTVYKLNKRLTKI